MKVPAVMASALCLALVSCASREPAPAMAAAFSFSRGEFQAVDIDTGHAAPKHNSMMTSKMLMVSFQGARLQKGAEIRPGAAHDHVHRHGGEHEPHQPLYGR